MESVTVTLRSPRPLRPALPTPPLSVRTRSFRSPTTTRQELLDTAGLKEAVMEQLKTCATEERPWEQVCTVREPTT